MPHDSPSLFQLVAEFGEVIVPRGDDGIDYGGVPSVLALPRYIATPAPQNLLKADIERIVASTPMTGFKTLLEIYFELREEGRGKKTLLAKHEAYIEVSRGGSVDDIRKTKLPEALRELAFQVFIHAVGVWHALLDPLGYEIESAEFALAQPRDPPGRRVLAATIDIVLSRPNVPVFVWGWSGGPARLTKPPEVLSRGHCLIGVVPHRVEKPTGDQLICVYLGDGLPLGQRATVILRITSQSPDGTPTMHLSFPYHPTFRQLTLSATVPPDIASQWRSASYRLAGERVPSASTDWAPIVDEFITETYADEPSLSRCALEWRP